MPAHCRRATALLAAVLVLGGACAGDHSDQGASADLDATASTVPADGATAAGPSEPIDGAPAPHEPPECPALTLQSATSPIDDGSLEEISGAAASHRTDLVLWLHEDSGNPAVLTAVSSDGASLDRWELMGLSPIDWEDIALASTPNGRSMLFVGDIGDNRAARDRLVIARVEEPASPEGGGALPADLLELELPSPADAEALLVDGPTGDVVVVTKDISGRAEVHVAEAVAWRPAEEGPFPLAHAGPLELGLFEAVLAGDVSPDGRVVVLRTPANVWRWERADGASLAETLLEGAPCRTPSVLDPVGEAVALLPGGGYALVGESTSPQLRFVR